MNPLKGRRRGGRRSRRKAVILGTDELLERYGLTDVKELERVLEDAGIPFHRAVDGSVWVSESDRRGIG